MLDPLDAAHEIRAYTNRLSERLRELRREQARLPSDALPFGVTALRELEDTSEELAITSEELRVQGEELAAERAALRVEQVRFERLFDLAPDPLLVTDELGMIVVANRAAGRLFAIARDRLGRKPLAAYLTPSFAGAFRAHLARLARGEGPGPLELEIRARSGGAVLVTARAVPSTTHRGRAVELLWTLSPLRLEPAPAPASAPDRDTAFLTAAAARLLRTDGVEPLARVAAALAARRFGGRAIVFLQMDGRQHATAEALSADAAPTASGSGTVAAAIADAAAEVAGTGRPLRVQGVGAPRGTIVVPLRTGAAVEGVLALVPAGAARRRRSARTLRAFARIVAAALASTRRVERLEAALANAACDTDDRSRVLSDLSHEIRTPLHSIMGNAGLLLDGIPEPVPERASARVRAILQGARHLAGVVGDVVSLYRDGHAPVRIDATPVVVAEVVEECAMMLRARAREAGLTLTVDVPAELELWTDRSKLAQIVLNLLGNAIKFTREGGVAVQAHLDDDRVVIAFRDSGMGIESAELPRIFEAFWRGSRAIQGATEGTGLGLALVHALVERLGGAIEVESEVGRGSSFLVTLPRVAPER